MTTHRVHFLAALAGLLLLGAGGTASAQSTITCESRNGQYQSCSANTSGGVTLSRQLSSQGCWQGDTWGYDRNRVWVTRGCRAEFRVGGTSSSGNNTGAKVAGALVLGAIVAAAIANKNDDRDDHYDNGYNDGWGNGREIRCESNDGRYTRCATVDRRQHVEIRRQLSNQQCIYGRNWGVDDRQLWVDDGCRAIFVAY
ncbi:DUF3011 domain-containing protein [Thermomonas carbonis]|uniref:DUF3011 domain-containing protein n=1 Tax=Thermomonas carbonis TaxID=1463158 RepID=A0A7G9SSU6_9GAMM|nr:DUF3011 domain-containing protein [Thermomonas carbonis]QNN70921.1 DUF3011 domain-containing protein [Thermomonas carbonis]GHC03375.1 hypothetical protein GCM10010080_16790 [Thermomonas carbonis]